jgi:transposase InsO family protein
VESFIGRLRDECLNETLFSSLADTRTALAAWRDDYNRVRPTQRMPTEHRRSSTPTTPPLPRRPAPAPAKL